MFSCRHALLAVALLFISSTATARRYPDGNYALSGQNSKVAAKVAYFGMGHKTVTFPAITGEFQYRASGATTFDLLVTADATKLDAGGGNDDEMLKGDDFFHADRFRDVTYHGTRLTFTGAKSAVVEGTLTVRGISKPLSLKAEFAQPLADMIRTGQLDLTATARFKRSSYGMKAWPVIVGDRVALSINARFVRD
jgi:polyisoprenoid-binding protein YceI